MPHRTDAPSVSDEDSLWRRIVDQPAWISQTPDGDWRISSAAFKDRHTGEVSVHVARLTTEEKALQERPDDGLAEIIAGLPRSLGLIVASDPTPNDPSHALICPPPGQNITKSQARTLADAARFLIRPKSIRS